MNETDYEAVVGQIYDTLEGLRVVDQIGVLEIVKQEIIINALHATDEAKH